MFWGWQTGLWFWGILMAVALEASSFTRARWEVTDADLNRICDLCWMLFVGAGLVLYSTEDRLVFIFKFVQWLPFSFFPIILAQSYGNREVMPLSAFSWLLRRAPQSSLARKSFHITFAYFILCVAAASASTQPNGYFYSGVALLILLALASVRPRRVSLPAWILLAALVAGAGQISQQGLRRLQNAAESALGMWMSEFFRQQPDSRECRTSIGQPGRLSQSGKIVWRVRVAPGQLPPPLLRQGAFDSYKNEIWYASSNDFASLLAPGANESVRLLPPKNVYAEIEIAGYFEGGEGPLALPHGTFEIDDMPANVRTNHLGVSSIDGAPGLLNFRARYGGGPSLDSPPGPSDTLVPDNEKTVLAKVASDLKLDMMSERQKMRAVSRFFRERFVYTLDVPERNRMTPLGQFLTKTRMGHCEVLCHRHGALAAPGGRQRSLCHRLRRDRIRPARRHLFGARTPCARLGAGLSQ